MQSFANRSIAAFAAMIATVATVGFAAPARADTVSVRVVYGDIDRSTPAGEARLARRIRHAADRICGESDAASHLAVAQCRRSAIATARMDLALAQVRTGAVQLAAK